MESGIDLGTPHLNPGPTQAHGHDCVSTRGLRRGENRTDKLDAHRSQIIADVNGLVDKHRAIFDWDIAEIDQNLADRFILETIRKALDDIE